MNFKDILNTKEVVLMYHKNTRKTHLHKKQEIPGHGRLHRGFVWSAIAYSETADYHYPEPPASTVQ